MEKIIDKARKTIYGYYQDILSNISKRDIPIKLIRGLENISDEKNYIFWKDSIIDEDFEGVDYFFGKIMGEMHMTAANSREEYRIILAQPNYQNFKGIKTFEDFTGRLDRKVFHRF